MGLFINIMPKPKQFQYRPLYYDERRERLEKRKAELEAERKRTNLQKGFIAERSRAKWHREYSSPSLVRLYVLVAIIGIIYLLFPELFVDFWKRK